MAKIKQIQVYENNNWNYYDIGADASNITFEDTTVEDKLSEINGFFNNNNILTIEHGGTGQAFNINNVGVLLKSSGSSNMRIGPLPLNNSNAVTDILPVRNGGTGLNNTVPILADLSSSSAKSALSNNIGVTGCLPVQKGGTGSAGLLHLTSTGLFTRNTIAYLNQSGTQVSGKPTISKLEIYKWGNLTQLEVDFTFPGGIKFINYNFNDITLGTLASTASSTDQSKIFYLRPVMNTVGIQNGNESCFSVFNINTNGEIAFTAQLPAIGGAVSYSSSTKFRCYATYISKSTDIISSEIFDEFSPAIGE